MSKGISFTKASLDAIKAPAMGRLYIHDEKIPNLGICVTSSGAKSFFVRGTVQHKRKTDGKIVPMTKRATLGKYPLMKIEQARKQAKTKLGEMAEGVGHAAEKRDQRATEAVFALTVEDAVAKYCKQKRRGDEQKPLKAKTIADYKWGIEKFLGENRYKSPIADLDAGTIIACYEARMEQSKARASNEVRSLRAVWNWISRELEYKSEMPPSPFSALKEGKERLYRARPKTTRLMVKRDVNELAPWLEEVEKLDPITREFFEWLLFTGNRLSEATELGWSDINWRTSEYRLENPRNREPVDLPIPVYLKPRLAARKKKRGPVFRIKHLARAERERVGKAIEKHWTNHDLRRTFSGIADSVISGNSVKRLMNHTFEDIAEFYISDAADLHEALHKVENRILELAGRTPDKVVLMERVK